MDLALIWWCALGMVAWLAFAWLAGWVWSAPNAHHDLPGRAAYRFGQLYSKLLHRVRASGLGHIPSDAGTGWTGAGRPLVVIANHTAGCDPLVIQSVLPFEARWIMAEEMRVPLLEPIWRTFRIITLDRRSRDAAGMREALAHLRAGGVLGIFPEGHLERPARHLLPFAPGVGLLIRRGNARVLPIVVDGTPQKLAAWDSLLTPSRTTVRVLPVIEPERWAGMSPEDIALALHAMYEKATGWPSATTRPLLSHEPPLIVDFAGQLIDETGRVWIENPAGGYQPTDRRGVLDGDAPGAIRVAPEAGVWP
jgi:1-acyl-sn-glycerol-3-phosphate acyltransferase